MFGANCKTFSSTFKDLYDYSRLAQSYEVKAEFPAPVPTLNYSSRSTLLFCYPL
jgi:hypothetical protein